ncbi:MULTISPECIES: sensor histidine kinase NtrY-like [Thalassospira]|jgi:two-component system, NtrC family, nitrogen regulation sensor histidine kinase NtrY|nr:MULTISPECIES: PAS domain-containing sensor histidine kinase [Thalassospira]MBL4841376.1 PAS domain-containing sensor histidine kinase [Thalassospira sp.]MCD1593841.1 PAS domain-containing sensor histidine kinase [Thalassospira xiamenensis]OCK09045.1 multi-sensor signal transduction histidine kinase [Thalassospira sp. KO164]PXX36495.1 two-component system nitrogen regulation sensor histidine kinase NtrY [Thalassospira sp. 11-3]QPL37686.1 PAS domain-containing sensor histidine kinase [Thalass|tara:strand:+ start:5045 stop:7318 length:2274 start_codon:yes stop_codon:yes gene_type:complete
MTEAGRPVTSRLMQSWFVRFLGRLSQSRKFAIGLVCAALVSVLATYLAMTGTAPLRPEPRLIILLLNIDLVLVLALATLVARKLVQIWAERRRGTAGAKLHTRMVLLFSLVAVTPAIIVAVFSALFLHFGIQGWFSDRIRTAVEESMVIAEAYLKEHQELIRADVLATANDLQRLGVNFATDRERINRILTAQADARGLPEAVIIDGSGAVLAQSDYSFSYDPVLSPIPQEVYDRARNNDVVLILGNTDNRIRAMTHLDSFIDGYLLVGRFVDPNVLERIDKARKAVTAYENLEGERSGIVITFVMIFVLIAVVLLLAAVTLGLMVATRLVEPISQLIIGAEKVSDGDLTFRVPLAGQEDELEALTRAFNRMTSQLDTQRTELVAANRLNDERRRFTEAILGGVTAGVIGLDAECHINLPNRSASDLMGIDLDGAIGQSICEVIPEFSVLFEDLSKEGDRSKSRQIEIRRDGLNLMLLARVTIERAEDRSIFGYVVTFDDVTELQTAQRMAAWADVARRIAHEIKNPLTPIQLSAERLKRRYLKEIQSDTEVFKTCTDTIIRQVGDIGRMVDEFSSFARMPSPKMKSEKIVDLVKGAVFLQKQAYTKIIYDFDAKAGREIEVSCDARQVNQCLTNTLKNAAEAIEGREGDVTELPQGRIEISVTRSDENQRIYVTVSDNGKGLPVENRERLTEPYVTTRSKGTGLGLAIVKKIMEDHGGELILADGVESGATITLAFPTAGKHITAEYTADSNSLNN